MSSSAAGWDWIVTAGTSRTATKQTTSDQVERSEWRMSPNRLDGVLGTGRNVSATTAQMSGQERSIHREQDQADLAKQVFEAFRSRD